MDPAAVAKADGAEPGDGFCRQGVAEAVGARFLIGGGFGWSFPSPGLRTRSTSKGACWRFALPAWARETRGQQDRREHLEPGCSAAAITAHYRSPPFEGLEVLPALVPRLSLGTRAGEVLLLSQTCKNVKKILIGELVAAEAGAVSILGWVLVLFNALAQPFHGAAMADQDGVESTDLVCQLFLLLVQPVGRVFRQQAANDVFVLEAHGPQETIEAHG